jgi:dipeptidyl aminopeptidase/acylaminoacyl peptidase
MRRGLLFLSGAAVSAAVVVGAAAGDQPGRPAAFPLTIDSIMRGPALVGYSPAGLRWSGDSVRLYFEWRMPDEDEAATWVVGREGGAPRRLSEEERRQAPLVAGLWDAERRRQLGIDRGDVVVIDTSVPSRFDVTRTTARESSPRWARAGTHVTFVRDDNLFIVPVGTATGGTLVQLTDIGARRADPPLTDAQRFLKDEEARLLDWVREAAERRKRQEARDREHALPRFELAERQSVVDAALSADETHAFLIVAERAANARTAQVPRFVSESSYTEPIETRIRVGDALEQRRLAVLNLATGDAVWAGVEGVTEPRIIPRPDPAADEVAPAEPSRADSAGQGKESARAVRWTTLLPSPDGLHLVASVRAVDNHDRWLVLVDPATGRSRVIDHVHDEAWVREIGPATNVSGGLGWLPDSRTVWFLAEHDGWMHLYSIDVGAPGAARRQLTTGAWEIDTVQLAPDGRTFYVQSTEAHPGERHLYALPVGGGERIRLTIRTGFHGGEISPDGRMFGLIHSTATRPPEVHLMANAPGADLAQVTSSPSEEWLGHRWVEPELVTYRTRDGQEVYARLYTPEMVGARRHPSRPAVIFVHGAGYLQNAHRYWSSYYREYMFHHLLAARGYVVLDPDYRASAGHGRDWRTAVYRWMGGHDLNDVVDGAAYLARAHRVDAGRIGVYGGSYGGFITLMAMFTSPDTFAAGAALRPVTDWAHYNHPYTSNILNEPTADPEAYRRSSPIYFAEGLKGALLICHGMVDVNVHFSDSVRLAQRLIELRKENWELAVYPVEDHGFVEETGWADEYKRVLKLFEDHLKR